MILNITNQENYSRGELLLRTLLGVFYIALPHAFILMFLGLWSNILSFISFWVILFTGRYPESFFEFQEQYLRWNVRLNARLYNLADGYPRFGLTAEDEHTTFKLTYPESLSRGHQLLKVLFGYFYVLLPHAFILIFRAFATQILIFVCFWIVLFTGKYPPGLHEFNVGTLRWSIRVNLYLMFLTDDYPPFSGQPDQEELDWYKDQLQANSNEANSPDNRENNEDPDRFKPDN